MKNPIVIPEFGFDQDRFPLQARDWESWQDELAALGVQIRMSRRQYLEDCESRITDLIAIQGTLLFQGSVFPFTAQLDFEGFGLYVGELAAATSAAMKLSTYLRQRYPLR